MLTGTNNQPDMRLIREKKVIAQRYTVSVNNDNIHARLTVAYAARAIR